MDGHRSGGEKSANEEEERGGIEEGDSGDPSRVTTPSYASACFEVPVKLSKRRMSAKLTFFRDRVPTPTYKDAEAGRSGKLAHRFARDTEKDCPPFNFQATTNQAPSATCTTEIPEINSSAAWERFLKIPASGSPRRNGRRSVEEIRGQRESRQVGFIPGNPLGTSIVDIEEIRVDEEKKSLVFRNEVQKRKAREYIWIKRTLSLGRGYQGYRTDAAISLYARCVDVDAAHREPRGRKRAYGVRRKTSRACAEIQPAATQGEGMRETSMEGAMKEIATRDRGWIPEGGGKRPELQDCMMRARRLPLLISVSPAKNLDATHSQGEETTIPSRPRPSSGEGLTRPKGSEAKEKWRRDVRMKHAQNESTGETTETRLMMMIALFVGDDLKVAGARKY
ncbi:hypothetical protein C8R45DRAFT_948443 [Mycena sanguinolenta]|nr:hypothetical protein C8R45DRAFT_948443 [Mycena sanguinolenta]